MNDNVLYHFFLFLYVNNVSGRKMILTHDRNGDTLHVKMGDLITVRLEENPTTGYRWQVDNRDSLVLVNDTYERMGDAIGAGGFRIFVFQASSEGSHELRLKNWRSWEGEISVIDRFSIRILVE